MIPGVKGIITPEAIDLTADTIAALQLASGQIPWFHGGHADPWNHVEAAMALAVADRVAEAERAYEWLAQAQHADGAWFNYYVGDDVEDARLDTNVVAYVATGVWHHYLHTGDGGFLGAMWPMVERALGFVLGLQQDSGEILWSREPDGSPGEFALLTGSASIYFSLRCAIAAAEHQGLERPDWELAAGRLRHAVAFKPEAFEPKGRWAMDWYYPVLSGALSGQAGAARLDERWSDFVMDGVGVRCVSDQPWVTAAETTECVMALDAVGRRAEALALFGWAQRLRHDDGAYWTGWVHPEEIHFPGGERTTYTSAAVILAANALGGQGPTAGLFRGEGLPTGMDLSEPVEPRAKRR
ncbi:MAG: prenyltransferase [Acidimicrobiales bacterium]